MWKSVHLYLVSKRQRMRRSNIKRLAELLLRIVKLTQLIEADAQVGQCEERQGSIVRKRRQPLPITAHLPTATQITAEIDFGVG